MAMARKSGRKGKGRKQRRRGREKKERRTMIQII
jgi:hypothetical protein